MLRFSEPTTLIFFYSWTTNTETEKHWCCKHSLTTRGNKVLFFIGGGENFKYFSLCILWRTCLFLSNHFVGEMKEKIYAWHCNGLKQFVKREKRNVFFILLRVLRVNLNIFESVFWNSANKMGSTTFISMGLSGMLK